MDEHALEAARDSGLVRAGEPLLVMLSGGADSVCLLDVAVRVGVDVKALHVNYGLRPDAGDDERHCRELCERLGVELVVERVEMPGAGQHAGARPRGPLRRWPSGSPRATTPRPTRSATRRRRCSTGLPPRPGRRALLGMAPRRGRLVRPLLEVSRRDTREYCERTWPGLARRSLQRGPPVRARACTRGGDCRCSRARAGRGAHDRDDQPPAADEAEVLDARCRRGARYRGLSRRTARRARTRFPGACAPGLRRLAERAAGRDLRSRGTTPTASSSSAPRARRSLDLGGGLRAVAEYGTVRFTHGSRRAPAPNRWTSRSRHARASANGRWRRGSAGAATWC